MNLTIVPNEGSSSPDATIREQVVQFARDFGPRGRSPTEWDAFVLRLPQTMFASFGFTIRRVSKIDYLGDMPSSTDGRVDALLDSSQRLVLVTGPTPELRREQEAHELAHFLLGDTQTSGILHRERRGNGGGYTIIDDARERRAEAAVNEILMPEGRLRYWFNQQWRKPVTLARDDASVASVLANDARLRAIPFSRLRPTDIAEAFARAAFAGVPSLASRFVVTPQRMARRLLALQLLNLGSDVRNLAAAAWKTSAASNYSALRRIIDWGTTPMPKKIFVARPFKAEFDGVYKLIKDAGGLLNAEIVRVDERSFTGSIISHIRSEIDACDLMIAVMTESNANVYYEVGLAHCQKKPVVLLASEARQLAFDLRDHRAILYDAKRPTGARDELVRTIKLAMDAASNPSQFISSAFHGASRGDEHASAGIERAKNTVIHEASLQPPAEVTFKNVDPKSMTLSLEVVDFMQTKVRAVFDINGILVTWKKI